MSQLIEQRLNEINQVMQDYGSEYGMALVDSVRAEIALRDTKLETAKQVLSDGSSPEAGAALELLGD